MKRPLLAIILLAGLLSIGMVAGGCIIGLGGGDTLSLDEYFTQLDKHQDDFDAALAEVPEEDPQTVDEAAEQFAAVTDGFADFANNLEDMNPPDEVADAHDATLAGLQDWVEVLNDATDDVASAETIDDALVLLNDLDSSSVDAALEGCRDLQQIADDNSIDVDLACDE
jgi:hypothetical protein